MSSTPDTPTKYKTDYRQRLAETPDYCMTEYKVSPGQQSPWHFHTATTDVFYVISGQLDVLLDGPKDIVTLRGGQSCQIEAGRVHRFQAGDPGGAHYLLIQGAGKPDFLPVQVDEATGEVR